jgi:hypothetical protein
MCGRIFKFLGKNLASFSEKGIIVTEYSLKIIIIIIISF